MDSIKVLVVGSREAGKRTFINEISEHDYVGVNRLPPPPDESSMLEIGRITLNEDCILHLFGCDLYLLSVTPPQRLLVEGMHGYVVLVDSTDAHSFYEARALLLYMAHFPRVPYIVVANKQDLEGALTVEQIRQKMSLPSHVPMMGCVAKERDSVRNVLLELLYMILPDLQEQIKP